MFIENSANFINKLTTMEYGQPLVKVYVHYIATNQQFTDHFDGMPGMGNQIGERKY